MLRKLSFSGSIILDPSIYITMQILKSYKTNAIFINTYALNILVEAGRLLINTLTISHITHLKNTMILSNLKNFHEIYWH